MDTYRVKAMWLTVQGEGFHAGTPAVFVRMVGCNMWSGHDADRARDAERTGAACPRWCDTDFTKAGSVALSAKAVARHVGERARGAPWCVLTGGEPLLQVDDALVYWLHREAGVRVAVETNGTVPLRRRCQEHPPDWITVSPKQETVYVERVNALKLVLPDYHPEAYGEVARRVMTVTVDAVGLRTPYRFQPLYVQPEDGPRLAAAKAACVAWVREHPEWKISYQVHKGLPVE